MRETYSRVFRHMSVAIRYGDVYRYRHQTTTIEPISKERARKVALFCYRKVDTWTYPRAKR